MGQREQRKRKVSSRLKSIDADAAAEARNTWLDTLEDDNHQAEQEAALLQNDDEYLIEGGTNLDNLDDDEEGSAFRPTSRKKRRSSTKERALRRRDDEAGGVGGGGIEKWNMSLTRMLQEEEGMERQKGMVGFQEITAKPSKRPVRPFCAVCGYQAAYTCRRCASRFCSLRCGDVHQQTQCLKMMAA